MRGENITDATHPIPSEEPPFKLSMADSSQVNFPLNAKAYEYLDFHLFLYQDTYQLVIRNQGTTPPPDTGGENGGGKDEDTSGNGGTGDGDADNGGMSGVTFDD